MSAQSNELFDIIKSLTPQEKTFFKAYFLKTKDESYTPSFLILFDAMNELEAYDRQELKLLLDKKGFRANYFKAQTYLTEAILKALTEYHTETENTIRIGHLLQQANVLIKKNLTSVAKKYFDRARKIADSNTMYEYQLLLDHLEFTFNKKDPATMDGFIQKVAQDMKTFQLETDLRKAGVDSLHLSFEHFDKHVPKNVLRKKVTATLQSLNNIEKVLPLNNFSKSRFYNSKTQCLMILEQKAEMSKTLQEFLHYLKTLPSTNAFFAKTVLHGYNSIIIAQAYQLDYPGVERTFLAADRYFHSLAPKICTPDISSLYYSYIVENILAFFNDSGQPEKTMSVWEENKKEILQFDKKTAVSLYLLNVGLAEFMLGNYHQAVRIANKIAYEKSRPAVFCEGSLLLLLSHYELNNLDILPVLAKRAKRSYEKETMFNPALKIFLTFFEKKAGSFASKTEEKKELAEVLEQIKRTKKESNQGNTTGSINMIAWLESKMRNNPYTEQIRKNAEAN